MWIGSGEGYYSSSSSSSSSFFLSFFLFFNFFYYTFKGYWLREKKLSIKKIPLVARPCKEDSRINILFFCIYG